MIGLPLESPPPPPEDIQIVAKTPKRDRDDNDDDNDGPSAKKLRRLSREFASLSRRDKQHFYELHHREFSH